METRRIFASWLARLLRAIPPALPCLLALACGGGSGGSGGGTAPVAPAISAQPQALTVEAGQPATFTVAATGTAPLAYQWRKGGAALPGATLASYAIAQAATADAGSYDVVVSNAAGTVTSLAVALTVNLLPPAIGTQPASQTVTTGQQATFSVTATGSAPLTYQWRKDGAALAGATGATYTIASVVPGSAGTYTVVVTNGAGSATSADAVLTVNLAASLDLTIDGMYVTQSTQTYAGGVPLLAGKAGLLRVFVKASAANTAQPVVRVRAYSGSTLTGTWTIPAPGASVPVTISEGTLASSWNLPLAATVLQPGTALLADVDPGGLVPEADKTNNSFPASGTPLPLDVATVPTWAVTIIPVTQGGITGNVTAANLSQWTARLATMEPVVALDAKVGAGYTSSTTLQSDGTGWNALLAEIEAKRVADGNQGSRYYYGAVATSYRSGTAGLGYIPGSATSTAYRSAMGWDKTGYADGDNFPEVLAHEIGHTFGRYHSPCGTTNTLDTVYPYAGGGIGVYGYDVATGALKAPGAYQDVMGYCQPVWISDYTYKGMLTWRQSSPLGLVVTAADAVQEDGLLVWGRVGGDGAWVLEPAFRMRGTPQRSAGTHHAAALDAAGREIAGTDFDLAAVADGPDPAERHFAFFLPVAPADFDRIGTLRLLKGAQVRATRTAAPAQAAAATLTRVPGGAALRWTSGHPAALVRDAATGEVVAIARDGALDLPVDRDLDVEFSDGIHSRHQRLSPQP